MSKERYPLSQVILDDLTSHNKVAILLLIGVVISAVATIWITHETRLQIAEKAKLSRAILSLDNRYAHLQLDENTLSSKENIKQIVDKFGLQPLAKEQEEIIIEERKWQQNAHK